MRTLNLPEPGLHAPNAPIKADDCLSIDEWPLIKKFNALLPLGREEIGALRRLHEQEIILDARKIIHHQGDCQKKCFIVNKGWAYRYHIFTNGERQIINYYLPGDMICPFALVTPNATYSVSSISSLHVSVFKPNYLIDLYAAQPKLASLYIQMLSWEDTGLVEQITRLGHRTAYQRTAHLLLDLFERLKMAGQADNTGTFIVPLTQQLLADTLSMSLVHMNRTLKRLSNDKLVSIEPHKISLLNIDKLKQIAEYQAAYPEQAKQFLSGKKIEEVA